MGDSAKVLRFLERSVLAPKRTLVRVVRTEDSSTLTTATAHPKKLEPLAGELFEQAEDDASNFKGERRLFRVEVAAARGVAECSMLLGFGEVKTVSSAIVVAPKPADEATLVGELRHMLRETNQALVLDRAADLKARQAEFELIAGMLKSELSRLRDHAIELEKLRNQDLAAQVANWKATQELLDGQNERDLARIKFIASQENWANGLKTMFGIASGVANRWLLAGGGRVTQRELTIARIFNEIAEDPVRLNKMLEAAGKDEPTLHAAVNAIFDEIAKENPDAKSDDDKGNEPVKH